MTLDRRDLIRVASGGVCGAFLTPMPWKLLDDTAKWSQNWARIPKVPRGEAKVRFTVCTMCPAGCGVKAECVGDRAVGVEGAKAHPASRGALCTVGFGAHTAAWHAHRVRQAPAGAVAEIAKRVASGARVGILDLGPERALSALYREAAKAFGNCVYLRMPDRQEATLNVVAALVGAAPGSLGIDLEHTRTLVSFGAPVLERWGVPGRVMELRVSGALRVTQVEARQSRTALAAERWIPVQPGEEAAYAVQVAQGGAPEVTIDSPAVFTGNGGPEEAAVAALNVAFGAVGREGGIVPRAPLPWKADRAAELASVPEHSIDVLFVDCSRAFDVTPWPAVRRKLAEGAVVVALAYREDSITRNAAFVLPVAAPFEILEDAETAPCAAVPSYSLSAPLIDTPVVKQTGVDHLNAILLAAGKAAVPQSLDEVLKQRVAAIHAAKKGTTTAYSDGAVMRVSEIASADDLFKKLVEGACWTGEPVDEELTVNKPEMPHLPQRPARDAKRPFTLLVHTTPDDSLPLMTKLYQESGLFAPLALARMHPDTAARAGVKSGVRVAIQTDHGTAVRDALVDPAVAPGVIEVAACAACSDIVEVSTDGAGGNWRVAAAAVRRA